MRIHETVQNFPATLRFAAAFFATALLVCPRPGEGGTDVCEQKVPASLKSALNAKFPGFRPAYSTDQTIDVEVNKPGGDRCMAVASGDFDGDGKKDIAILLTNPQAGAVRLVVALRRNTSWAISQLPTWCTTVNTCYVQTVKAGSFKRSESLDSPPTLPDERDQIESKTDNVMSGTLEATGIVYVYSKGKWRYVWISD
jgi:hypothetical protein